jgi:hypothetical protein
MRELNTEISSGIGIGGQFGLDISLKNNVTGEVFNNFISLEAFDYLVTDEYAGLVLPMMKIRFKVADYSLIPYINQGNSLIVTLSGPDYDSPVTLNFQLLRPVISSDGNLKLIDTTAILNVPEFTQNIRVRTFKNMTSMEAMYAVTSVFLEPDFGRVQPNDKQSWIQSGVSDIDFCLHLVKHSNFKNSFPIVAITSDGKFRHRDFYSHVRNKVTQWWFIPNESDQPPKNGQGGFQNEPTKVIHGGNIKETSDAGILNRWRGNGSIIPVYRMDVGGPPIPVEGSVFPGMLTGLPFVNRNVASESNILPVEYESDSTYLGFAESKSRNVTGSALYSSQKVKVTISADLLPIQLLDLVYLEEPGPAWVKGSENFPDAGLNNPTSSGFYIITRISRKISLGGIETVVELCRESQAEQFGALK